MTVYLHLQTILYFVFEGENLSKMETKANTSLAVVNKYFSDNSSMLNKINQFLYLSVLQNLIN